jgi:hypothetical protein
VADKGVRKTEENLSTESSESIEMDTDGLLGINHQLLGMAARVYTQTYSDGSAQQI